MQKVYAPRHELKYFINEGDALALSRKLGGALRRDAHGDANNEYFVRSLYFDDAYDSAYLDKLAGVPHRDKYRIRIYNCSDKAIFLERKRKVGDLIAKSSARISPRLCRRLIDGNPRGLEQLEDPLLRDLFVEMRTRLLRPKVIVDYAREAYCHPAGNARVTLDKRLRTGYMARDLFDPDLVTFPPLNDSLTILEVKFDGFLPAHITQLLSDTPAERLAISKYTICRRYEPIV